MMIPVACCQVALDIEDPAGNTNAVLAAIERAAQGGARVIVCPELANSGYVFCSPEEARARALLGDLSSDFLAQVAQASRRFGVVVAVGFCERSGQELYSSAAVIDGGQLLGVYRKTHLWDREKLVFTPGDCPPQVVDTSCGRFAVAVCYDIEFPETIRLAAQAGAIAVLAPVNWPAHPPVPGLPFPLEIAKAVAAAAQYRVSMVIADRAGTERGVAWEGSSAIIHPGGALYRLGAPEVLPGEGSAGENQSTQVLLGEIPQEVTAAVGPYNDIWGDRRTDIYAKDPTTPRNPDSRDNGGSSLE